MAKNLFRGLDTKLIALSLIILLFLIIFSGLPIASIVIDGLYGNIHIWISLITGNPTEGLKDWSKELSETLLWMPLSRSIYVALLSTLISTSLGVSIAWLGSLTDISFKRLIFYLELLQLILPPLAMATFWNSFTNTFDLPKALSYGPIPMAIVLGIHFQSLVFLIVSNSFKRIDQSLIDAAIVHGASNKNVSLSIILKLCLPSILASSSLVMFFSLWAFAPIFILGSGQNPYYTLSIQIYSLYLSLSGSEVAMKVVSVLAIILMLISIIPFILYYILVSKPFRYGIVSSRWIEKNLFRLGKFRVLASIIIILFLASSILVPLSFLLIQPFYSPNFPKIFDESIILSLFSTLSLGISVASIATILSLIASYLIIRLKLKILKSLIYILSISPFIFPGVSLGIAYLSFITSSLKIFNISLSLQFLYGSLILVIIVNSVINLAFGIQIGTSSISQIDESLEESAKLFGASLLKLLRFIVSPILKNSIVSSWILIFIFAVKEVDTLMFLYSPLSNFDKLSLDSLFQSPPIMYTIFNLINSQIDELHYLQGSFILASFSIILLLLIIIFIKFSNVRVDELFNDYGGR